MAPRLTQLAVGAHVQDQLHALRPIRSPPFFRLVWGHFPDLSATSGAEYRTGASRHRHEGCCAAVSPHAAYPTSWLGVRDVRTLQVDSMSGVVASQVVRPGCRRAGGERTEGLVKDAPPARCRSQTRALRRGFEGGASGWKVTKCVAGPPVPV